MKPDRPDLHHQKPNGWSLRRDRAVLHWPVQRRWGCRCCRNCCRSKWCDRVRYPSSVWKLHHSSVFNNDGCRYPGTHESNGGKELRTEKLCVIVMQKRCYNCQRLLDDMHVGYLWYRSNLNECETYDVNNMETVVMHVCRVCGDRHVDLR